MKKIIITLLFSLTLFANSSSCKLDVYFGNGVLNDEKDAKISMIALKDFMRLHNPGRFNTANKDTYNFKYAHNKSYGVVEDLIETHWQLYESGQISELYFSFVANALNGVNNTNPDYNSFLERLKNIIEQYNIDATQILEKYREESFNLKHNVLLVAHSQGNLFGNKIYELLTDAEKKKFEMVSIATPADKVAKRGNYTTLQNDPVIMLIPNALSPNANGFGHTFVESYLENPIYESVEAIAKNIKNAVDTIDKNSCSQYKYFRWISYMCPNREDTELEVAIYGTKDVPAGQMSSEEFVLLDSRQRAYDSSTGKCLVSGWDYRTDVSVYDKNGCMAYTFDDTSGNYHSLDYIASRVYENSSTCTRYRMDANITQKLKDMQIK